MTVRTLLSGTGYVGDQLDSAGCPRDWDAIQRARSYAVTGKTANVYTVTVSGANDSTAHTLSIGPDSSNLTTVTYTSGVGATTTTIAAGLAAAINATVGVSNLVYASSSAAVITITSRRPGTAGAFAIEESDSNLGTPSETVAAADETGIYPGQFAEEKVAASALSLTDVSCAPMNTGTYTAQVTTVDVDGAGTLETGDEIEAIIWMDLDGDGIKERIARARAEFDTDQDTTLDALIVDLNADLPANSVLVAADNATATALVCTSEIAGVPFDIEVVVLDASANEEVRLTNTATTANAIPTLAGLCLRGDTQVQDSSGNVIYKTGSTPSLVQEGEVYVALDPSETVSAGDYVFVRVHAASGSERRGDCRNDTDSGDCIPLSAWGYVGQYTGTHGVGFDGQRRALARIRPL